MSATMLAGFKHDFLTTSGRIGRLRYWKLTLKAGMIAIAIMLCAMVGATHARYLFLTFGSLALIWALIANATIIIRRLHDHDRNGWLGLVVVTVATAAGYVGSGVNDPVVTLPTGLASLASTIYLGFMRGTNGPNSYDSDSTNPDAA